MSVTRISDAGHQALGRLGAGALALLMAISAPAADVMAQSRSTAGTQPVSPAPIAQARMKFVSPEAALEQGISAFRGGNYEIAIPALEAAAAADSLIAQYFLARVLSDNLSAHTDHAKAYQLYQRIANDHADVDSVDDRRAPYVAKSFVALARYLLNGLPEIGVRADAVRAAEFVRYAATYFNDPDAQFEYSKLLLNGDGVGQSTQNGLHFLSMASKRGHPGAQAFLADLYWRGKFVKSDPVLALSLITVAVENAPASERVWIEDIYQNIFCGAPSGTRQQADGMVANWRQHFRFSTPPADRSGLGTLAGQPVRTCANGEVVGPTTPVVEAQSSARTAPLPASPSSGPLPSFSHGPTGLGFRETGSTTLGPVPGRRP